MSDPDPDLTTLPALAPRPIFDTGMRLISERMAAVPDGKKRVAVFYYQPDGRIGFGTALRIGDDWEFSAEIEWNLKNRPEAFVGLRWSD